MIDLISLSALIVAIIAAIGTSILGLLKVIKRSSCMWGFCDIQTTNDDDDQHNENGDKKTNEKQNK